MSIINDALKKAELNNPNANSNPGANPGPQIPLPSKKSGASLVRILILVGVVLIGVFYIIYTQLFPFLAARFKNKVPEQLQGLAPNTDGNKNLANIIQKGKKSFEIGQLEHALKLFQEALLIDPNNSEVLNNLGMVYRQQDNMNEALKYYQLAIEKNASCAECFNNMGVVYTKQNSFKEAGESFIKAITLKPEYPDAYFNYGALLETQGNSKEAIVQFENFIQHGESVSSEVKSAIQAHIEELKNL
ncbi:MAG: tetratricopeptide repeat protein [Deltaproteobacteria bacterium]|nr:tetratricopeptide repeat protein [Deltaproteobacteria bacterium]